jgi:hypothetical protein
MPVLKNQLPLESCYYEVLRFSLFIIITIIIIIIIIIINLITLLSIHMLGNLHLSYTVREITLR